ncbi:MAG TPA: NAD(P)/FAD-dependent oxidoreductase [Salegentibacter sp.]|nr:NAD(P)/FAD-dependent oxidoreductase [Salegentibacter sp.]
MSEERIIIIGGGLSGLTLAYKLSQKNIRANVLEASSRIGGRIQTIQGSLDTPLELGATWFSEMHPNLLSLIEELGLKKYPQFSKGKSLFQTKSFEPPQEFFVPESENPSYRIVGGTQMLIDTISQKLPAKSVRLNSKVTAIKEDGNELSVEIANGKNELADKVILCLPPRLVASQIGFMPNLPIETLKIMPEVQTWMEGSIKFVLEYDEPFWRNSGYSGMLYSHSGIVAEMYDHTNFKQNKFGFTGFLNAGAANYPQEVRKTYALRQLGELLGEKALKPITYIDKIWNDEFVSGGKQLVQRPHQNNGHPLLQQGYLDGKLFFSGTETAKEYSGYMEGAVISAFDTAAKLYADIE